MYWYLVIEFEVSRLSFRTRKGIGSDKVNFIRGKVIHRRDIKVQESNFANTVRSKKMYIRSV